MRGLVKAPPFPVVVMTLAFVFLGLFLVYPLSRVFSASLFDPQSGVNGGGGNETIWGGAGQTITDNGIQGYDTVVGFSQSAGDRLSFPNDSAAAIDDVLASARISNGNTILNLPDGSSFTLIDLTHVDSSFFV